MTVRGDRQQDAQAEVNMTFHRATFPPAGSVTPGGLVIQRPGGEQPDPDDEPPPPPTHPFMVSPYVALEFINLGSVGLPAIELLKSRIRQVFSSPNSLVYLPQLELVETHVQRGTREVVLITLWPRPAHTPEEQRARQDKIRQINLLTDQVLAIKLYQNFLNLMAAKALENIQVLSPTLAAAMREYGFSLNSLSVSLQPQLNLVVTTVKGTIDIPYMFYVDFTRTIKERLSLSQTDSGKVIATLDSQTTSTPFGAPLLNSLLLLIFTPVASMIFLAILGTGLDESESPDTIGFGTVVASLFPHEIPTNRDLIRINYDQVTVESDGILVATKDLPETQHNALPLTVQIVGPNRLVIPADDDQVSATFGAVAVHPIQIQRYDWTGTGGVTLTPTGAGQQVQANWTGVPLSAGQETMLTLKVSLRDTDGTVAQASKSVRVVKARPAPPPKHPDDEEVG